MASASFNRSGSVDRNAGGALRGPNKFLADGNARHASVFQLSSTQNSNDKHAAGLLSSWKDISNYLSRGVRTVQRWERTLGLPVHRMGVGSRAPVFAFAHEIDGWLLRQNHAATQANTAGRSASNAHRRWLLRLIQELRIAALQLEHEADADGFTSDANISEALHKVHAAIKLALARGHAKPIEIPRANGLMAQLGGARNSRFDQRSAV